MNHVGCWSELVPLTCELLTPYLLSILLIS